MKHYLYRNHYLTALIVCVVLLGLFLVFTNPARIGVGLLIVPVILLFLISFCAVHIILAGLRSMKGKPRKKRLIALVSASLLTIVMILQSTGGIAGVDLLLLGLIIVVAVVYISKF